MAQVSVVVPCFNVEEKIERCINSIKEQTYKDFLCYFIDDGSTDGTASLIKKLINNDQRFVYRYKSNGGQASARNLGLELCDTKYITFVDSDDYLHQDYLFQLINSFDDGVDLTACFFDRVYENRISRNEFNEKDLLLSKYPAVWGKMIKTSIIKKNHIQFPEGLWYEDLCFFATLTSFISEVNIVKKSLYYYIQNENSTMYTYSDKIYDIYKIFDILKKDPNIQQDTLEYLEIYHILIGTIYRASFKTDFTFSNIKCILEYVENRYPKWYKNHNIKTQLSGIYRIYLWFLQKHCFRLIFIALKFGNRFLSL